MGGKLSKSSQLEMVVIRRKRDKNGGWRGGARPGAGRPKLTTRRASERHQRRERISRHTPLHVILRATPEMGSLRTKEGFAAVREATIAVFKHEETFRIVHFSIQRQHVHLIVEANDYAALARGMKAFSGSVAKHLNASVSKRRKYATRRRGSVFVDRYHAKVLRTPTQVRNTIAYVLNNWRHHREDRDKSWRIDPFASGLVFDGWKEREGLPFYRSPNFYDGPQLAWAKTFLLKELWKKRGLVSVHEVPGGGLE